LKICENKYHHERKQQSKQMANEKRLDSLPTHLSPLRVNTQMRKAVKVLDFHGFFVSGDAT
jgi:hypothetical protein